MALRDPETNPYAGLKLKSVDGVEFTVEEDKSFGYLGNKYHFYVGKEGKQLEVSDEEMKRALAEQDREIDPDVVEAHKKALPKPKHKGK